MKTIRKILILTPVILISVVILSFFISPILNNISLSRFANQLDNYHIPQKTVIIEKRKVCGKLNGNGNGMDFFACILVKSDLSISELKQYYNQASFKPARITSKNTVDVKVSEFKGRKLATDFIENKDVNFDFNSMEDLSKYYILMIYDGGYPAGFDIRGN